MDSKTYVQSALRTESTIEQIKVDDEITFQATVEAFIATANLLDMYKKNIFYGKEISNKKWVDAINLLAGSSRELQKGFYPSVSKSKTYPVHIDPRVFHAVVGIATEAGELVEAVHKQMFEHQTLDVVNVAEEIGDVNWYEAILIDAAGADWDSIRQRNIDKLKLRYPEKFEADRAINRDLDAERKLLEGDNE